MTREQAFEVFMDAVCENIPELGPEWPARRAAISEAGVEFAHAAAQEVIEGYKEIILDVTI